MIIKAVRSSRRVRLNRDVARRGVKSETSRNRSARCQRNGHGAGGRSRAVQRIVRESIQDIGFARQTIHIAACVIHRHDRGRVNSHSRGSGRTVGGVQVLADRVIEAVRASRGARINRDIACCRVKAETSRDRRTAGNGDGNVCTVDGRPIEGVVSKHIENVSGTACAVDAASAVINRLNRCCDHSDGFRGNCTVCRVQDFTDLVVKAVRASGRAGLNRRVAGGRVKGEASRNCRTRSQRNGDSGGSRRRAVQRVAIKGVKDIRLAREAVDPRNAIVSRVNRSCNYRHGRRRCRAIGGVEVLTDRIVEAVSTSSGARIDRYRTGGRVKAEASRNRRAGRHRDRDICAVDGRPIEGVVAKHIENVGGPARTVDAACTVIDRLNGRCNDSDGGRCSRAVRRVQVLTDRVVEAVGASWRVRVDRHIAGGRVKAEAGRNT